MFGIRELSMKFRQMDQDRSGFLSAEETALGLQKLHVYLDAEQQKNLFDRFDRNGDGLVSVSEFLMAMRGPLSQRRLALISKAFAVLDRDGSGVVTLKEMCEVYGKSACAVLIRVFSRLYSLNFTLTNLM